ncbi:MAG: hypothetical protein QNJ16_07245 [Rhodobacter sp.]|nr:hypothetical protein [Rhodobacter sp.]
MTELLTLFLACFIVAIVPGPLAVVAFQGGLERPAAFVFGLLGQLLGLAIMTNILVLLGNSLSVAEANWFLALAGLALLTLGIKTLTTIRKSKGGGAVTFGGTFVLAFTNPKAVLGFGPPLLLFHGANVSTNAVLWATTALISAVTLSMLIYFALGRLVSDQKIVGQLRKICGVLLVAAGVAFLVRQLAVWVA